MCRLVVVLIAVMLACQAEGAPVIIVGGDRDYPPYEFLDETEILPVLALN